MALRVTAVAERALRHGHPWLFDQAITEQSAAGVPGDLAVIFDAQRRFLAIGLYDPTSAIRVRVLQSRTPATINGAWFAERLQTAVALRAPLTNQPSDRATNGYRLVHGENDHLPGLIIDRYAETLVLKLYSPIWIPHLPDFCAALQAIFPAERIILRLSRLLQKQPAFLYGLQDGRCLFGSPLDAPLLFQENGLTFECDPIHGQKTGFFLDQRDNRAQVEALARGKRVLNVFSYSGGFSLYAARGGAVEVVSVDLSAPALQAAERNFAHNAHLTAVAAANHQTIAADAFATLADMQADGRLFDMVIIDPPMFAQNQSQMAAALSAYRKLTRLGLGVLRPGGTLVQASCSSRIEADSFFAAIHQTAQDNGRSLRDIARTGHALDHPITYPEGAYLKCLFATAS